MAIDNKKVPGSVTVVSSEDRWKQFRPDGGFGGAQGADDDTGTTGSAKGKGKAGKPGIHVPRSEASTFTTGQANQVGAGTQAGVSPSALPASGTVGASAGNLEADAAAAANSLPVTSRVATTAADPTLSEASTPLSQAIDKLSDDLASKTASDETLKADITAYAGAMQGAKASSEMQGQGLHTMMASAGLTGDAASHITALATSAGLAVPTTSAAPTVADAQAALTQHLADPNTDPGIIALAVQGIKNAAQATTTDPVAMDTAVTDAVDAATQSAPASNLTGLAALYAAAAKEGVDLSQDGQDKMSAARNKKAQAKPPVVIPDDPAPAQSTGGTGGGNTGGTANIQAPTYDKAAAASPYGAKENLSAWTQQDIAKGTYNNEQQRYTTGGQNISFGADGSATLTAKNEGNGNWSSARITGEPVGKLPAYLEATITNPSGQGTWPAFWMTGTGSWPQGGEIDVMEQVNGDQTLHTSNHWGATSPGSAGEMPPWSPTTTVGNIDMTQPHRYGVMITDSGTQFYLDGKKIGDPVVYPPESNFPDIASKMVPTINLAMGGTWPGAVPNDLPDQTMKVSSMTRATKAPDET